ncbi:hypothetical protein LC613_09700 [Nostoc sphaeroides CHAB 2801]|nr:hypothetical protein [Nostoc sphaeroides]MCC5628369.1 hypothetical protein [Nostoc sphaeroides CHAB 2801]
MTVIGHQSTVKSHQVNVQYYLRNSLDVQAQPVVDIAFSKKKLQMP